MSTESESFVTHAVSSHIWPVFILYCCSPGYAVVMAMCKKIQLKERMHYRELHAGSSYVLLDI